MTHIQLDECMDSKRLVKACSKQNIVHVLRFPGDLKTKQARQQKMNKDEVILPILFAKGNPVLTSDFPIDYDNAAIIPDHHPGIIIIANAKPTPNVDWSDIQKTIDTFKICVPNWHLLKWENSITEITLEWVAVRYIAGGRVQGEKRIDFTDGAWPTRLAGVLSENAQRSPSQQLG
jgi:hypothetical protein